MKTVIEGVRLGVDYRGQALAARPNGYIGKLRTGEVKLLINILPERTADLHGFTGRGNEAVKLLEDNSPLFREKGVKVDGKLYSVSMTIRENIDGIPVTDYPSNVVRLLEIKRGGEIIVWRVYLVSEDGEFYAVVEPMHESRCFRDDRGKVVSPFFSKKWPELLTLLSQFAADRDLPPVSEYRPEAEPSTKDFPEGQGVVVWYSLGMRFGHVRLKWQGQDIDARAHVSGLRTDRKPPRLMPGEIVSVETVEKPTDPKTSFKWEARGVSPLQS